MILSLCPNPSIDMFAWIEDIQPKMVNRIKKEERFPGGKGVHVALAAAELGEEVKLLGFWGGANGQWIKEVCKEKGVECYGPEVEGSTRFCMTFKSEGAYKDTEILGSGPEITPHDFDLFIQEFTELAQKADVITMSGSWPKGAPSEAYARLIKIAKQAGKRVLLDCTGEQLQHGLQENPFLVHLNEHEGKELFDESSVERIAALLKEKCAFSAVTAGARGLYLGNDQELIHAHGYVEKIYSTVGSGDCLLAGLAVGFSRNLDILVIARLGVACGGANCMEPALGMLKLRDVNNLFATVEVKSIINVKA